MTRSDSVLDWFFRSRTTGRLAIVQLPNFPLVIYLAATTFRLALHPSGTFGGAVTAIAGVSLAWWSVDEIVRGESPFRRLLGGVVLVGLALNLLMR